MRTHVSQQGFSLLEALIAILILSIGLLGVAGLNLLGLRGAQDSTTRSVATQLSYEIADIIRANPTVTANYLSTTVINPSATPTDCYSVTCTAAQQATFNLIYWARSISDPTLSTAEQARQAKLPGGQAVICRDSTPDDGTPTAAACSNGATDPVVVKLWWNERAMNATESASQGATIQRRFAMAILP